MFSLLVGSNYRSAILGGLKRLDSVLRCGGDGARTPGCDSSPERNKAGGDRNDATHVVERGNRIIHLLGDGVDAVERRLQIVERELNSNRSEVVRLVRELFL